MLVTNLMLPELMRTKPLFFADQAIIIDVNTRGNITCLILIMSFLINISSEMRITTKHVTRNKTSGARLPSAIFAFPLMSNQ
ncbi:MAG: hypothetical protein A4E62_03088 [Syntrophorhabdus sp. PtaU1.Bin002]|nr:MAG: hypothetical protein A4E62_03088 [Syntrophorhabdus sp. PtaU1.Bin002]